MRGLYAIVDPEYCAGRDPRWVAEQILSVGCAALQLRAKHMSDRDQLSLARELRALCNQARVPFWINDRADLALLVEADGLHLGQDDISTADARRLWGARPIGRSSHSLAQAHAAVAEGADVLGFGPVYATQSKQNPDPQVGPSGLQQVCSAIALPVIAIGGIKLSHVPELKRAGATTCAVISALCAADDPAEAARAFNEAWQT